MTNSIAIETRNLNFYYPGNSEPSLKDISIRIEKNKVTALIGPSGCGKTTLLRCFNRMHDLYPGMKYEGEIIYDGKNMLEGNLDLIDLRSRIGMVFQKPTAFPMSIFDNVAYGLKLRGVSNRSELADKVEESLRYSALWEEVNHKLDDSAYSLSGGQQQRLVIARAIAVKPEIILCDEPTSALDPISTSKIEELIAEIKKDITIIIVTHNMQQAARISDMTGFCMLGELEEFGQTNKIFTNPDKKITEDYITGRFG